MQYHTAHLLFSNFTPSKKGASTLRKKNEIIEKVTKPTDWCSPIVPERKQNGDVRVCVDLKYSNATSKDSKLQEVIYFTLNGWPKEGR